MLATLALLWCSSSQGDRLALASEPRLQSPLTLQISIMPVSRLLETATSQTGLPLRSSRALGDLKLALRVRNRSAGWVLDQAAEVLDLSWRKASDGYELIQPAESAQALRDLLRRQREKTDRSLDQKLSRLAALSKAPFRDLAPTQSRLDREIGIASAARQPGWTEKVLKLRQQSAEIDEVSNLGAYALGRMVQSQGPSLASALRRGEILAFALSPDLGLPIFDPEFATELRDGMQRQRAFAMAGLIRGELVCLFTHAGDGEEAEVRFEWRPSMGSDPPALPERFQDWRWPRARLAEVLGEAAADAPRFEGLPENPILADALIEAAVRSNVDLVADSFRDAFRGALRPGVSRSQIWAPAETARSGPFLKAADGAVLYRHAGFWDLRESEIPEAALEAMNRASNLDRAAFYAAGAVFATSLTDPQRVRLGEHRYEGWGANVLAVRTALAPLMIWGKLSPGERAGMLERQPLPCRQMSNAAQIAFRTALREYLLLGGSAGPPETAARLFLASLDPARSELAFLTEANTAPYALFSTGTRAYPLPIERAPEGALADGMRTDHYFYLGFDAARSVRYAASVLRPNAKD